MTKHFLALIVSLKVAHRLFFVEIVDLKVSV